MLRLRLLIMALIVTALVAIPIVSSASTAVDTEISRAAIAPYVALAARDADGMCSDFTASAAVSLADKVSHSAQCDVRVAKAFAAVARPVVRHPISAADIFKVHDVVRDGLKASASIVYGQKHITIPIELQYIEKRWKISTVPILVLLKGCVSHLGLPPCTKKSRTIIFSVGSPTVST